MNVVDEFDWSADPAVVQRDQQALAVYSNKYGQIVVRGEQQGCEGDEGDPFVRIAAGNAERVCKAILAVAAEIEAEEAQAAQAPKRSPPPKPQTPELPLIAAE